VLLHPLTVSVTVTCIGVTTVKVDVAQTVVEGPGLTVVLVLVVVLVMVLVQVVVLIEVVVVVTVLPLHSLDDVVLDEHDVEEDQLELLQLEVDHAVEDDEEGAAPHPLAVKVTTKHFFWPKSGFT
jgi:cobalamin biosynthesis protein CobD/CbiB